MPDSDRMAPSVSLPTFARPLDQKTRNRYLQAYRRWAYDQAKAGKPVACWCLYIWIAGNWRSRMDVTVRPMVRPAGSTAAEWAGWGHHRRLGGHLSYQEYMAKRRKRSDAGQGHRTDIDDGTRRRREEVDEGLRMEPSSVLAKFARLGLLPKARPPV
jgi:hypothetical protein